MHQCPGNIMLSDWKELCLCGYRRNQTLRGFPSTLTLLETEEFVELAHWKGGGGMSALGEVTCQHVYGCNTSTVFTLCIVITTQLLGLYWATNPNECSETWCLSTAGSHRKQKHDAMWKTEVQRYPWLTQNHPIQISFILFVQVFSYSAASFMSCWAENTSWRLVLKKLCWIS